MIFSKEYLEFNPANKNKEWFGKLVTYYRRYWRPVVNPDRYQNNMNLILSANDMQEVAKMFREPKKMGFEFIPIAVMEKVRNVLFGERAKAGISAEVKAVDPTSEGDEKVDKTILKTRQQFEGLMTYINGKMGLPEFKLSDEKQRTGESPFAGNLEKFDELGLDPNSPQDISYFFLVHWKLLYEIDNQTVINAYMGYNEMVDYIETWLNDVLAVKAIGGQVVMNQVTGAQDYAYLQPDKIKTIPGSKNNSKTAVCNGFEDNLTVNDVIAKIGNEFDFNRDLPYLVQAVNYYNGRNIVEVFDGGTVLYAQQSTRRHTEKCSYDEFSQFKVGIGYIETKTVDATGYKIGRDAYGNQKTYVVAPDTPLAEGSPYQKEVRHKWVTYKSWYLSLSTTDQVLFNFGKLYHQAVEGSEDEYSNYSIFWKLLPGPSVADVARPWISIAQECFYKMKWMIRKAKPKGRSWNYESLVKMAKHMIPEGSTHTKLMQLIKMYEEGMNEMFTLPEVNGEKMGGGANPHQDLPNGLDPTALTFKGLIEWVFQMISADIGMNDVRTAESMAPNSGYRLQMSSMEASRNATEYINYLIDDHVKEAAKRYLLISQDVVRYKTTVPYAFLKDLIGETVLERIALFLTKRQKAKAMHRFAIFIHAYNSYQEKQEIKQQAFAAQQKGEIPFEVMLLVNAEQDWKKAAYILSYEKKRGEKMKQEEAQQSQQYALQLDQQKTANQANLERLKGSIQMDLVKAKGYWDVQVQDTVNQGEMQKTQMKIDAEPGKEEVRTNEQIKREEGKQNIKTSHELTA